MDSHSTVSGRTTPWSRRISRNASGRSALGQRRLAAAIKLNRCGAPQVLFFFEEEPQCFLDYVGAAAEMT